MASKPNPIDIHVGKRLRLRRTLLGMSQERLGELLGLTFQQVQKYERGANRIGSSRLFELGQILDVPVSFFFDDLPDEAAGRPATPARGWPRRAPPSSTTTMRCRSTGGRPSSWCAPTTGSAIPRCASVCSSWPRRWPISPTSRVASEAIDGPSRVCPESERALDRASAGPAQDGFEGTEGVVDRLAARAATRSARAVRGALHATS